MTTRVPPKSLPPLAGLCSLNEAMKPGLSVAGCVSRLKHLHYAFRRLHDTFIHRITSEPLYELKMGFSHHAYLCAEHASALRLRVGEMREPPLGLEEVPHAALQVFFDEILAAPGTQELLLGIYEVALPALEEALERHRELTNPLADQPTLRLAKFALLELDEMCTYGAQAIGSVVSTADREGASSWLALLDDCLAGAGGIDGAGAAAGGEIVRRYSAQPHVYNPTPRRDARFPDPYNMGVNAEVFLYDPAMPPQPKALMMFYKRLREIDVPEMMASILAQTPGKPWAYHRDMTRQLWDEARHAMMGEVGFVQLGIDWPQEVRVNFTWSLALNTQLSPRERHGVLYYIEQGLMPKTGKRFEWEVAQASGNPLSALFQDYDWADEVLHARIGRDWYLSEFDSPKEAVEFGDAAWSRVLMGWARWRDQGLTQHCNWWPGLYRAACKKWGIEPDPAVLSFDTSYEQVRADLKVLSASG